MTPDPDAIQKYHRIPLGTTEQIRVPKQGGLLSRAFREAIRLGDESVHYSTCPNRCRVEGAEDPLTAFRAGGFGNGGEFYCDECGAQFPGHADEVVIRTYYYVLNGSQNRRYLTATSRTRRASRPSFVQTVEWITAREVPLEFREML